MNAVLIVLKKYASIAGVRRAFYLFVLCLIALIDFIATGKTSKTFVFYGIRDGAAVVETRQLPRHGALELRATRYVEEALLGPSSVDFGRLFLKGSRLESLFIRDGVAYVNLSAEAALPGETEVDVRGSLATLTSGLLRNFRSIKKVRIFISGHEPFAFDTDEGSLPKKNEKR
jgi:hypothetical protein